MIITDALLALVDNKGEVTEHPENAIMGIMIEKK